MTYKRLLEILQEGTRIGINVKKGDAAYNKESEEALKALLIGFTCWVEFLTYMDTKGSKCTDIDKLKADLWDICSCKFLN